MTGGMPAGVLRAALNLNNTALVQKVDGNYSGIAVDLARRIAAAAGLELHIVDYPSARAIVEAVSDGWDIAFLASDPARTDRLAFSRPYHRVEATFLVRSDLPVASCAEVVAGGHTIVSARGAAYHTWLAANLPSERLIVADSPREAAERFRDGYGDVLGGIRETLAAGNLPGCRILPDSFAVVEQTVAVPIGASGLMQHIEACLREFPGAGHE